MDLAEQYEFIAGVVGWVDLKNPVLGKVLDQLSTRPFFKGVRHVWHDEPDDEWILQPQVIEGLKELADRQIPYDFLTFPRHLKYIPRVLDRVPELSTVVDHISKPPIEGGDLEPLKSNKDHSK